MKYRQKSWIWLFTFPFAHNNYTTIGTVIYCPDDKTPPASVVKHEAVHSQQQEHVGLWRFMLLYLFCLPILWNPWRKKWEREAYKLGNNWDDDRIGKELASYRYGWLL